MKRKYWIAAVLALTSLQPVKAQSVGDLIEQLLLDNQKLIQVKQTLRDMVDGYNTIKTGLEAIKDIAKGNFDLHKAFLDALLAVSPAVRDYKHVKDILNAEQALVKEYQAASKHWHASGQFSANELLYIDRVYSDLFDKSVQCVDELTMVLTDDVLRMSDAQRMQTIDRIYGEISGLLQKLRSFNTRMDLLDIQRRKGVQDLELSKRLYDNPD